MTPDQAREQWRIYQEIAALEDERTTITVGDDGAIRLEDPK